MKKLFLTNKWTATLAVTAILSFIAAVYFIVVAIFHIEPYLSSDEKGPAFVHYGGDYGIMLLVLSIVLLAFAWSRTK